MIERNHLLSTVDMIEFIRQSNLIEGIDNLGEDAISMEAWNWLKDQPRLSRDRLLDLHTLITHNQLPVEVCGQFRESMVVVGGRVCPEPYLARHMIMNWLFDMRNSRKLDPKKMHIRFETIHPFIDGNGRTGRMLMWWHEMHCGQAPTMIKFSERHAYYGWFK